MRWGVTFYPVFCATLRKCLIKASKIYLLRWRSGFILDVTVKEFVKNVSEKYGNKVRIWIDKNNKSLNV